VFGSAAISGTTSGPQRDTVVTPHIDQQPPRDGVPSHIRATLGLGHAHIVLHPHGRDAEHFKESADTHHQTGEHQDAPLALFRAPAGSPAHAAGDMAGTPSRPSLLATPILEVRHQR
jgi:hypothetical protein